MRLASFFLSNLIFTLATVFAYYDYLWMNQKQYDDKILLMNDRGMSSDLRGKLALFLYKDVIQGVTLFER